MSMTEKPTYEELERRVKELEQLIADNFLKDPGSRMAGGVENPQSWMEDFCSLILRKDKSGHPIGIWGIAQDITDRQKAEKALRESEEKWRNILVNTPQIGIALDPQAAIVFANKHFLELTGWQAQEIIGRNWFDLFIPEDIREEVRAVFHQVMHSRDILGYSKYENEIVTKRGERRKVAWSNVITKDAGGAVVDATCLGVDLTERERAEEALRESEALLAQSQQIAHVGSWMLDVAANRLTWSDETYRIFGLEPQEFAFTYEAFLDAVHPQDRVAVHTAYSGSLLERKDTYEIEHRIVRRHTGEIRYVYERCVHERDSAGVIFRSVGMVQDITERKRAEEALRESEAMHRALVDGLPDIIMRFDRDGRHLFVSENVRETGNLQAAQFIGKTHGELGFPEAQCRFYADAIQRVFDSGAPFETEFTFEGQQEPIIYNWRLLPERDEQGAVRSVFSISRDITGHRKAERDYQTLFRDMLDGFALHEIICDGAGQPVDYRFLAVNPAFECLTGLKAQDIVGKTVLEALAGTERHWIDTYGRVAQTGEAALFEDFSKELNKYFEVTAFSPAPNQFACIFTDITARKRAEEEREKLQAQLNQAQKMESVGRLAGGVAHDFNNMLSVIIGNTELAMDTVAADDPLHDALQEIFNAARHSADITRQLLTFARKQTIAPKVLDLNETIQSMLKMLQRLIGEDIDLAWFPGAQVWPVRMDPSQIHQILANLCVNARDAITDVGKITIESHTKTFDAAYCAKHIGSVTGDFVLLEVSDNGCGMDQQTLDNLFEPFFTTKDVDKGTGLGLATVYGIVKQNHGFIDVYSEAGQGTSFKIYLPRHDTAAEQIHKKVAVQRDARGSETILLVEDEPAILKMIAMMLRQFGYTVLAAGTPGEAIRLAREHAGEIHLLITDVVMPEMNGRDLARNLLSFYPDLKRLFISGYTANVIAHHGILDEGVQFLQKPFTRQDMAVKVREVLDETEFPI
ncbi:MAG: PAS domain S-box protein [Desulfobacteraceae bacterium]|nr:MAG: PAS domain S-box protein [Desulfobacteraceae bacterium]